MPPPVPPRVYAGRMMTGRPISRVKSTASSTVCTTLEAMHGSPIFSIVSLNIWRSSALAMVSGLAPSSLTPI